MTIIDVDSHFEPTFIHPEDHPLHPMRDRLPSDADLAIEALAGDLWSATDPSTRAALEQEVPVLRMLRGESGVELGAQMMTASDRPAAADDADARVRWMDELGIAFALVNPGGSYSGPVVLTRRWLPERRDYQAAVRLCNDFLALWTAGHTERLAPVTLIDVDDIEWSVAEIERMRGLGSRAVSLRASAFGGLSPAHPANDRLWQAMTSLGMVGVLHIGSTPAEFHGGWSDAGWLSEGGGGVGGYLRFANSARIESAQKFISSLVFGAVFERVPNATIILSELWASWIPWFASRFDMLTDGAGTLGPFDASLRPQEFVRRNVKATPLPGLKDNGMGAIADIPEMLVFSSDFPHNEGNADPIAVYGDSLDLLPDGDRAAFLGATMLDVFARTGDPLPVAATAGP